MGAKSRNKGKRGEREAAAFLRSLGIAARRGQQFSGIAASDVEVDLDVHVEVKFGYPIAAFDVGLAAWHRAIEQAQRDAAGRPWVVLWRPLRQRVWRATLQVGGLVATLVRPDDIRLALLDLHRHGGCNARPSAV